jgi:hypothetical protein
VHGQLLQRPDAQCDWIFRRDFLWEEHHKKNRENAWRFPRIGISYIKLSIYIYILYPNSSKSLDHDLVLKHMVSWGTPIYGNPQIWLWWVKTLSLSHFRSLHPLRKRRRVLMGQNPGTQSAL